MADILQMHDLKPAPGANKDRIRVGRGEGSKGKTSGRGDKGTKKRYQVRPGFEGGQLPLYMRLPKGAVRNGFPVKVLGDGEVSAAYTLKGVKASASAKSKIEAAGGSISED